MEGRRLIRAARIYLPVALCLLAIAGVAAAPESDLLKGVLLIAAAAVAIVVLDVLLLRRGVGPRPHHDDSPVDPPVQADPPRR